MAGSGPGSSCILTIAAPVPGGPRKHSTGEGLQQLGQDCNRRNKTRLIFDYGPGIAKGRGVEAHALRTCCEGCCSRRLEDKSCFMLFVRFEILVSISFTVCVHEFLGMWFSPVRHHHAVSAKGIGAFRASARLAGPPFGKRRLRAVFLQPQWSPLQRVWSESEFPWVSVCPKAGAHVHMTASWHNTSGAYFGHYKQVGQRGASAAGRC